MRTLRGRRVLITGAASGIGLALAGRFATEGSRLVLTDIDEASLQTAAEQLRGTGASVTALRMDVTDAAEVAGVRHGVNADGGPIDVLVNNAGTVFGGAFHEVPLERHLTTLDVNLRGPLLVTHAFLPDLISRPEAHLVTVASLVGMVGAPGAAAYAASKWGVIGLAESLELELTEQGHTHVHVTTVCPGLVSTGLFDGAHDIRLIPRLTADVVADRVVRAVLADRPYVRIPLMVRLVPALRAALPHRTFNAVIGMLGGLDVMVGWTGRPGHGAAQPARAAWTDAGARPAAGP